MQNVGEKFSGTEYLDSARERIAKPGEGEAEVYIAIEKVRPNPLQLRMVFSDGDLKAIEVAFSVTVGKKSGLSEERLAEIKSGFETFIEKTAALVIKERGE